MRPMILRWVVVSVLVGVCLAVPRDSLGCVGDCNRNAQVTIDELVRGVGLALGTASATICEAIDNNLDGTVAVNELVRAVGRALNGCGLGLAGEVLVSLQGKGLRRRMLEQEMQALRRAQ